MSEVRLTLMEAIACQKTVTAHYNGSIMKLAPHLMFERRGDLFVSALNMSKNWRSEEERRLGHFKLDGLAHTALLDETFAPLPSYQAAAPQPEDTLVLAI